MKKNQIEEILLFLKQNTELSNIFGQEVFYGLPVTSPKTAFLCFQIISSREEECYLKDLLVFTVAAEETGVTALQVKGYLDTLEESLAGFHKIFGTFETFRTSLSEREQIELSDTKRFIAEKTFTFSYAK